MGYTYDSGYLAGREARAISFSIPLQEDPYADRMVRPFFSGLLPDEGARQRLAGALAYHAYSQTFHTTQKAPSVC